MPRAVRATIQALILLAILALAATACGPAGSASGTLELVVSGLPSGTSADIQVAGRNVSASTTLTLAPGTYELSAQPVVLSDPIMGDRRSPTTATQSLTVSAGASTTVNVSYTPAQTALLLAPNYGNDSVTVLRRADLVEAGQAFAEWELEVSGSAIRAITGMALGPDGRLYVTSANEGAIFVVDAADFDSDGPVTPAAIIASAALRSPRGPAFDSRGQLWIGDYTNDQLLRFDDVLNAQGPDVSAEPALVVSVNDADPDNAFSDIQDVFVDHLDNVWVASEANRLVYRFEGLAELASVPAQGVQPALMLTTRRARDWPVFDTVMEPMSLVVDTAGRLYVGTNRSGDKDAILRVDDATSLSGIFTIDASAYLEVGAASDPRAVALDQSGALWVGYYDGTLVRITAPESGSGSIDLGASGQIDRTLSWQRNNRGFVQGGTLTFVPTQGPQAGH